MTVREALDAVAVRPPDAAIIDLVLPDGDGVEVCSSIREWSQMPILVLSAVGDEREKVRALDAGADDYVDQAVRPRRARRPAARRPAARRAVGGRRSRRSSSSGLVIDLAARRVSRDGEEIHLTPTEYDLLRHLVRTAAACSPTGPCCARSGAPAIRTTPRCCGFTSPTCGARSSRRGGARA